jgi:molecular chaperone GrpE
MTRHPRKCAHRAFDRRDQHRPRIQDAKHKAGSEKTSIEGRRTKLQRTFIPDEASLPPLHPIYYSSALPEQRIQKKSMSTQSGARLGRILLQQSRRGGLTVAPTIFRAPVVSSAAQALAAHQAGSLPSSVRWFSEKAGGEEKPQDEATAEGAGTEAEVPPTAEEEATAAGPSREEELEGQVKDLKDQLLRSLAEQDNTRRIAKRDVDAATQFAIKSFAKSLLDVSDNLTRALEAVPAEMRRDKEANAVLANLYEGIEMTDRGLVKAFERNGLVMYGEAGELFDPNKHEALYEYVDPEKKEGTVGQVMKPGFMLRERVLRPAEVGVIKKA